MRPRFSRIALLGALAASAVGAPAAISTGPQPATVGQQRAPDNRQSPTPVQTVSAAQFIRQISGGYSMVSRIQHPIWIGRLRDSGSGNRGVSRRGR